ncbi:MAG TPA: PQQ-dependent sugar dehydrogenase [Thermoanaerobaculia bacterium]|nr:PQQ-dependent sugar dehydrogenase [Thermoanaerobaculia bacterium]
MQGRALCVVLFWSVSLAGQQLVLQPIATGLTRPLGLVTAGDSRLFIVQQLGQILIYDGTRLLSTPFLDVSSLVTPNLSGESERGLLGLAFDPHYATNGFFFIYYTDRSGNITLARYSVSANRDRADPNSAAIVLTIDHTEFPNHNGGQLQFGPDGYLYLGPGDGGSGGDPHNHAQDLSQRLGKLLRIDVSTLPYRIPPSNPFVNTAGARPEIWAYGLRNPWRFTFDRNTGDLFIADVGQDLWEEVDLQPATSIGGENYGWRRMEATHCFNPTANCQDSSFTLPILEYSHAGGACSITGGYRYHGAKYPRLHDIYFYGDFCSGAIFGARQQSDGTWTSQLLLSTRMAISSFGEDANGEIYVIDWNGGVYQITDTSAALTRRRTARH